jgi:hypothetical protein
VRGRRVQVLTDAPVHFGLIPHDHWYQPDWIDEEKATAARNEMVKNQVIYGGTLAVCHIAHLLGSSLDGGLSTSPFRPSLPSSTVF